MTIRDPLLTATGIAKTFDRTRALAGAHFDLLPGEVHGLLGANGAGKSTLSKVITGHVIPDEGQLVYRGQPLRLRSTRDALDARHRHRDAGNQPRPRPLGGREHLPAGTRPQGRGHLLRRPAPPGRELLATLGQEDVLPLDIKVRHLSAAQRQLVEIAKALGVGAELIIFDEPTASLSPIEVERLFDIMTRLRERRDRADLRLPPAGGSVRDHRPRHDHARRPHGAGVPTRPRSLTQAGADPAHGRPRPRRHL